MGKFLVSEKPKQATFKATSAYFSEPARTAGTYRKKSYPFCLPREDSAENLWHDIRRPAIEYFRRHGIHWHDGIGDAPSNHLCDSQVCCANFLFPFANQPEALAALLRPHFPSINRMEPIEDDLYVAFEWIGAENYLGEKTGRTGTRTRGAHFTSTDAAVMFRDTSGRWQIVLIEWKYTESYSSAPYHISKHGTDRTKIYEPLFTRADCPIDKTKLAEFGDLFYEPFYQFMRQQFLAHEMERARELGAERVTLLHIAPAANTDFRRVTSPALKSVGNTATGVWKSLLREPEYFISVSTEELFGAFPVAAHLQLQPWWAYLTARYGWVQNNT